MTKPRRKYSREIKLQIVREIEAGKSPATAAREYEVHPTMISQWRKTHAQYGEAAFAGNGHLYKDEARIAELERKIGQLVLENDLLKKVMAARSTPPFPKAGRGAKR